MRRERPAEIIDRIRRDGVRPGEQRAYIMANVLARVQVTVAGAVSPDAIAGMGFDLAPDLPAAIAMAVEQVGRPARALVIPHALLTLPIVRAC
jgi:hypothetical protein